MADKNDKLLVAAIDFGITLSGYAFSCVYDHMRDPLKISTGHWVAGSDIYRKTPTCVLLSPKQEFKAFGYEAEDLYSELALDEIHHDHYFFEGFKMLLYKSESTQKLSRNSLIKDVKGKEVPALDLFAHVIRYLKDQLLTNLDRHMHGFTDINKNIHWVLPVPAIWENSAKYFMREAANQAGIPTEKLTICLDSEAAFLYCQKLDKNMMNFPDTHSLPSFRAGTKYMIIDLGGQTAEITIYLKKSDGTLEELHRPTGGLWGSSKINEAFERMMIEIVGSKVFEEFKNYYEYDYIELCREFEMKKRKITTNNSNKICIKIPIKLAELFGEETGKLEREAIDQTPYANKMTWRAGKLRMNADLIEELFTEQVNMLVKHLKKLMTEDNLSDISTLLMVGEFSESPVMHDAIIRAFPDKRVIQPVEAGIAVLYGAVLFGHESGAVPESIPPGLM